MDQHVVLLGDSIFDNKAYVGIQRIGAGYDWIDVGASANVSIRKNGALFQVVDNKQVKVIYSAPLNTIASVRYDAYNGRADTFCYDVGFGGYFTLPGGVHYEGGYGDGDRFWYERSFSGRQLSELRSTSLADVISRNTEIDNLQDNVFVFNVTLGGQVMTGGVTSTTYTSMTQVAVAPVLSVAVIVTSVWPNPIGVPGAGDCDTVTPTPVVTTRPV